MYAQADVAISAVSVGGRAVAAPVRKTDRTMHAAGGLGTSIDDAARWLRLQLGRGALDGVRLLSTAATEATWELLSSSTSNEGLGSAEGFAFAWERGAYRGHLELRHGGDYVGLSAQVCFLPKLGLGLAVTATGDGAQALCRLVTIDVHERLLADDEVRDPLPELLRTARARRERAAPAPSESPVSFALPAERYAGVYRNEWLGTLTLEATPEGPRARLGDYPLTLRPSGPETLAYSSPGPLAGEARLELADDRVTALVLDLRGPVRFAR